MNQDTLKSINECMRESLDFEDKLRRHFDLRKEIIKAKYPLSRHWRTFVIIFGMAYIMLCSILVVVYGLQFHSDDTLNEFERECFPNIRDDINASK